MAKQGKVLPARRVPERETSVLLRSAESLGRVIGLLQRQLDGASKRDVDTSEEAGTRRKQENGGDQPAARPSTTRTPSKAKRRTSSAKAKASNGKASGASKRRSVQTQGNRATKEVKRRRK